MSQHIHGGDVEGYLRQYGRIPLDFSANVSPLGVPAGVRSAILAAADGVDAYPDPQCRQLREALARYTGVGAEHILCGCGAADLIFRLAQGLRPKTALVTAPTFAEYEAALVSAGCQVRRFLLQEENSFALTEDILSAVADDLDVLFLCQPNNPTGMLCPRELLLRVLDACTEHGVVLAMDECFLDLTGESADYSLADQLESHPNLIIFKAFTKRYAMAGIRLGYALCYDQALLGKLRDAGQPWSVSSLAQAAGLAALGERFYVQRLESLISTEKAYLLAGLAALPVKVYGHAANYIFFSCDRHDLHLRLREHGILIRDCSNYEGLGAGYYRIAVRRREENVRLLEALDQVLKGEG